MRAPLMCVVGLAVCLAAGNDAKFLPATNLIDTKVADRNLLGTKLPPGGVLGHYRDAKGDYRLLLVRMPTTDKAAFFLLDVKKLMSEPHYLAHMGGFAGQKDGAPFYVFAKGPFVAAIAGKPEIEADALARVFAGRLPLQ